MNDEVLRVEPTILGRIASAFADLPTGADDARALAEGAARLRATAPSAMTTGATADAVHATENELREVAAATASFADAIREAAQRYSDADDRAADRLSRPP
jgi:hypothetical protein